MVRFWGVQRTYGNLKIYHLLRKRAHLIVEAKSVLSDIVRRKDKVALSLLCSIKNELICRSGNRVVDIEGAAGLDLQGRVVSVGTPKGESDVSFKSTLHPENPAQRIARSVELWYVSAYSEIKCHFCPLYVNLRKEACLLMRFEPVCERGGVSGGKKAGEQTRNHQKRPHHESLAA